jgi:hypothetical protein
MGDIITLKENKIVSIDNEIDEINHEHMLWLEGDTGAVEHSIRCGQLLSKKKGELPHGEWSAWVVVNCNFSINTARNYMKIASNSQRVMDLPEGIKSMHLILKLLAEQDEKIKPKVHRRYKTAFTWFKEENVQAMKEGNKAIHKCLDILMDTTRDRKVAEYIIRMERKALVNIIDTIDRGGKKRG